MVRIARSYGWCGHHNRRSEGSVAGVHTFRRDGHADAFGWPDWVFWHPTRHRFIVRELKVPSGVLSRHQRRTLADLCLAGIDAKVWLPADWPEIVETFAP